MGMHRRTLVAGSIQHLLVLLLAAIFIVPLLWMLSTALKGAGDVMQMPPSFIPNPALWQNFGTALTAVPFWQYLGNSGLYTGFSLVGDILSSSMIAYAFARLYSRWSGPLFLLVLATLMIPYQVLMIPQFILFKQLGWLNTYLPLIVPTYFGSSFLIFLLRQFFRGIPRDFDDAAKVDGASHLVIFWRIILPLSKPALASVAIFSFMYHWNDYLGPLIYLNSNDLYPTSLGLAQYTASYGATEWNYLMAASLVTLLPCLVVFFIGQRYFVQGITLSGVKG
jgi:multiple sugar transport system permease protein